VARYMFFLPPSDERRVPVPATLAVVVGLATAVTLAIGLFPQPLIDLAAQSVKLLGV